MGSTVLIVIVNYRTAALAADCLQSLAREIPGEVPARVVVVDNDSRDGSSERLRAEIRERGWGDWASVVDSGRNGGFAAGNNVAIRSELERAPDARARYVLLLNPDTVVRPGALRALLSFMDARPEVGIAGGRIEDGGGRSAGSARRFPTPLGELESAARLGPLTRLLQRHAVPMAEGESPLRCDWVSGAAMMVRSELFGALGLLDENFFLYFEETDFCHRAVSAGWQVWLVPECRVVHYEGSSTGIRQRRKRRPRYWYESRRRFFLKVHGPRGWLLADCCWALGRLIWTIRSLCGLARAREDDPTRFASDLLGGDARELLAGSWRKSLEPATPGVARRSG